MISENNTNFCYLVEVLTLTTSCTINNWIFCKQRLVFCNEIFSLLLCFLSLLIKRKIQRKIQYEYDRKNSLCYFSKFLVIGIS